MKRNTTEIQILPLDAKKLRDMVEDAKVVIGTKEEKTNIEMFTEVIYSTFAIFDDRYASVDQHNIGKEIKLMLSLANISEDDYRNTFKLSSVSKRYLTFEELSKVPESTLQKDTLSNYSARLINLSDDIVVNIAWYETTRKLNSARKNNGSPHIDDLHRFFSRTAPHWSVDIVEASELGWSYEEAEKGLDHYRGYIFRMANFAFKYNFPMSENVKQAVDIFIKKTIEEKKRNIFDHKQQIIDDLNIVRFKFLEQISTSATYKNTDNFHPSLISLASHIFPSGVLSAQEVQVAQELEKTVRKDQQEIGTYETIGSLPQLKYACRIKLLSTLAVFLKLIQDIEIEQNFPLDEIVTLTHEITQAMDIYTGSCSQKDERDIFKHTLKAEIKAIIQPFTLLPHIQIVLNQLMALLSNHNDQFSIAPIEKKLKLSS